MWERWARYVYQFEHLEEAQKLEKRIAEAYPNGMLQFLGQAGILTFATQTRRSNDLLRDIRTSALTPLHHVISAWRSSVKILQAQTFTSKSKTVSASQLLLRVSVPLPQTQVGGGMSEITHPTNVSASPQPHETVTEIENGIETGRGIGTESAIDERPPVDDMDLRSRGSGTGNEREMPPRDGHTTKKKKRRSHQSHSPPSFLGLSARCLNRQSLMVGVNPHLPFSTSVEVPCYRSGVQNGRSVTSFQKRRHSKCQPTKVPRGPSPTMYISHCSSPRRDDADHLIPT